MGEIVVVEIVGSEPEAELVCSLLRAAGIECMHRMTNVGSGAADGMPVGGPREILVRDGDLDTARKIVKKRR